jgi:hypothetical protein
MAVLDDILKFIAQYNALVAKNETKAAMALASRYQAMYKRIAPQIEALAQQIADGKLTVSQVRNLKSLALLEKNINEELTAYSGYIRTEIPTASLVAAGVGATFAYTVLQYLTGGKNITKLDGDGLTKLMSWLQPGSALFERLGQLAGFRTDRVIQAILDAVGKGVGPRQVAREIMNAAEGEFGGGLVDALRMSRTSQLWADREASRANYIANSDIVTGWIWIAELDSETCMSCVAQHGERFDLDEVLDDHHNGRCTMIPEIQGQNPVDGMTGGKDWFNSQDEKTQKDMLGPGKYEAWKDGQFDLSQLSTQKSDDVYGTMRTESSLKDLVGE